MAEHNGGFLNKMLAHQCEHHIHVLFVKLLLNYETNPNIILHINNF